MKAAVWMCCAWNGYGWFWVHDSVTFSPSDRLIALLLSPPPEEVDCA